MLRTSETSASWMKRCVMWNPLPGAVLVMTIPLPTVYHNRAVACRCSGKCRPRQVCLIRARDVDLCGCAPPGGCVGHDGGGAGGDVRLADVAVRGRRSGRTRGSACPNCPGPP